MKKKNNFVVRLITGICLMLILIPTVYFGGIIYLVVSSLLSVMATYELLNMFYTKHPNIKSMRFVLPLFSGLTMICFYFAINNGLMILPLLSIILGLIVSMLFGVFKDGTDAYDILSCITSLIYGGLLLPCAFSIEYLVPIQIDGVELSHNAGRIFAYVYSIVVGTDIFAYCFGMLLGKHRLCPKISPKKSVEGAVSGLLLGALAGTIVGILLEVFPIASFSATSDKIILIIIIYFISMILSATSQLGDLVASKLKRTYEIKDYGFIFPGHGGVMDRFDSLILTGSLFFCIMQIIYILIR